jgi:sugar-specific transcriptional regulator TrmB
MPKESGQQEIIQLIMQATDLSAREVSIYVKALGLPPLPVTLFAKQCGISRQNAYNILAQLEAKGLVLNSSNITGRYVQMVSPEYLKTVLDQKIQLLQKQKSILPEALAALKNKEYAGPVHKARVSYYDGIEGVRKLYRETLLTKEKILRTCTEESAFSRLGNDFVKEYITDRMARGIHNKIIQTKPSRKLQHVYKVNKDANREFRVPPPSIVMDSLIVIFDQSVVFITLNKDEPFGTRIESTDYSATMKSWYDAIFKISTPLKKIMPGFE